MHAAMTAIFIGLEAKYADGWKWNVGTGGWLRITPDPTTPDDPNTPPFPDIIHNILTGDIGGVQRTLDTLDPEPSPINTSLPPDFLNVTPLMLAVYRQDLHMVRFLIENGADLNQTINILTDVDGSLISITARDMAEILNYHVIVDIITEYDQYESTILGQ